MTTKSTDKEAIYGMEERCVDRAISFAKVVLGYDNYSKSYGFDIKKQASKFLTCFGEKFFFFNVVVFFESPNLMIL